MLPHANLMGLLYPGSELLVDVLLRGQFIAVAEPAWAIRDDLVETGMVVPLREAKFAQQEGFAHDDVDEAHLCLKADTRFLGDDDDLAAFLYDGVGQFLEKCENLRFRPCKERREFIFPTRMPHIA